MMLAFPWQFAPRGRAGDLDSADRVRRCFVIRQFAAPTSL